MKVVGTPREEMALADDQELDSEASPLCFRGKLKPQSSSSATTTAWGTRLDEPLTNLRLRQTLCRAVIIFFTCGGRRSTTRFRSSALATITTSLACLLVVRRAATSAGGRGRILIFFCELLAGWISEHLRGVVKKVKFSPFFVAVDEMPAARRRRPASRAALAKFLAPARCALPKRERIDCVHFAWNSERQPDLSAREIGRVLKRGRRALEMQVDLAPLQYLETGKFRAASFELQILAFETFAELKEGFSVAFPAARWAFGRSSACNRTLMRCR